MSEPRTFEGWVNSEEFDGICYAYRVANLVDQARVVEAFSELRQAIIAKHNASRAALLADRPDVRLLQSMLKCSAFGWPDGELEKAHGMVTSLAAQLAASQEENKRLREHAEAMAALLSLQLTNQGSHLYEWRKESENLIDAYRRGFPKEPTR